MNYEEFYKKVCNAIEANYSDPADFANEIIWLVAELKKESLSNNVCSGRGLEPPRTEYIYSDNPNDDEGDK